MDRTLTITLPLPYQPTMSSEAYRRQAQSLLESTFSRLSCAVVGIIFRQQNHNFTLAFRQLSTINETSDSDQFNIKEFDITDETLLVEIVILLQPLLVRPRQQVQAGRAYPVCDTQKKKSDSQTKSNEAAEEEEDIETLPTKITAAFKTVLVSPGKIGLTLNIKGNDTECRLVGQVDVGDIIVSIDGTRITSIDDFQVNAELVRQQQTLPQPPTTPDTRESQPNGQSAAAAVVAPTPGGALVAPTPGASSTAFNEFWAVMTHIKKEEARRDAKRDARDDEVQARLATAEQERLQILRAVQNNMVRINEVSEAATFALTVATTAKKKSRQALSAARSAQKRMDDFAEQLQDLKGKRLFDERDGNVNGQEENVDHRDDNGKCNHII